MIAYRAFPTPIRRPPAMRTAVHSLSSWTFANPPPSPAARATRRRAGRAPGGAADPRRLRLPRGRARQRDHARRYAALARAARDVPAYDDRRIGAARRASRRPDGQFGSRPPQHRRGPRRLPGFHADRRRDPRRAIRAQCGAGRRRRHRACGQRDAARARAFVAGRRAQPRASTGRDGGDGGVRAALPRVAVHAFLDGRDTPPRSAGASLDFMESVCARFRERTDRLALRALLRDGPRQALGAGCPGVRADRRRRRGTRRRDGARRTGSGVCARRKRRIRAGDGNYRRAGRDDAHAGRRRRRLHELPRRSRARADPRADRSRLRRLSAARASRGSRASCA